MEQQLRIIKETSILIEEKKYIKAKDILLDYIKREKNSKKNIKFYYNLYLTFNGLGEIKEAKRYLEKCYDLNKKNYIVINNLANIFLKEGKVAKAEEYYLRSFNLKKDYLLVIVNLAVFYQNIGRLNESKKFYLKAIELSPKNISLFFNLSKIDKDFIDDKKIEFLSNLMKNDKISLSEMSYGYFLLAENEKKKKNYNLEIDYLKQANKYSFDSLIKINLQTLEYWKNVVAKNYKKFIFKNENKINELKNYKPIFIIGLPRSGSTVIEVLLTSKNVPSLGESNIFNGILAQGFSNRRDMEVDLDIVRKKIINIIQYKDLIKKDGFFIDKSLENFFYIDVILKVFPNALFINSKRNIEDNVFAIFKQSLNKLSWTHSIEEILEYLNNYFTIINYFKNKYSDKIFSVELEELSNNPKEFAKKLYSFCKLEWSEKALEFNNKQNLHISTASNVQIRDKIKKYDQKKYEPYKSLLKNFYSKYEWLN